MQMCSVIFLTCCVPAEAAVCNDFGRCDHHKDIERYYDEIINAMAVVARHCIPFLKQR